jgi:hypothetical protein
MMIYRSGMPRPWAVRIATWLRGEEAIDAAEQSSAATTQDRRPRSRTLWNFAAPLANG